MYLTFKFPTFEEFSRNRHALNDDVAVPRSRNSSSSRCESLSSETIRVALKDKMESFPVREINDDGDGDSDATFPGTQKRVFEQSHDSPFRENSDNARSSERNDLWVHQELIDQLKFELKKARAVTGLPTILEESEIPMVMEEDLRPRKIDVEDRICELELHKFHKSYGEKMRKLDILNFQKIGLMQLKDPPQQPLSPRGPSGETLKSLSRWLLSHHRVHENGPTKKFATELLKDLEVVYVGHVCLSWELLRWQYERALDLRDSGPRGAHRYNRAAGEFQHFQVLVQRFVEDEPYRGPRVRSYVESRCALRNLLQVPLVREDSPRDKRKAWNRDKDDGYAITIDLLVEILEESLRMFWKFILADKDCNIGCKKRMPELTSHEDLSLLMEVRRDLLKKEKKLKERSRMEKWALWRLKRRDGDEELNRALSFFSQVDVRLVGRVLNMSNKATRDQLIWCKKKIHVEQAFLLFPC